MSSYQAIFDKSVQGILAQGCQSWQVGDHPNAANHGCQYRGPDGLKCAIGHIISDEQMAKYKIREGVGVSGFPSALYRELNPDEEDAGKTRIFLISLQHAHDNVQAKSGLLFRQTFIRNVNEIAERFNLKKVDDT